MEEVFNYLKALDVNFLATRNGEGVSCRPFGDPVKFDGKIYMLTHAEKDVTHATAEIRNSDGKVLASYEF